MSVWAAYISKFVCERGGTCDESGLVARYGDLASEYALLATGPAIVDRADRAILEVTGADRATWLHNLTTNVVKTLSTGDGKYSFVTNVQGRILFDVNIIVRPEILRLDVDRGFLEGAIAHFDKYIIIEDVVLCDRSDELVVFALCGDCASEVATTLGASQMTAMPDLNSVEVDVAGVSCLLVRNSLVGGPGFDLHVPTDSAIDVWTRMVDPKGPFRAKPVGGDAVHVRRVEAGIPWSGVEITSEYLPAETMQFDRAVSFQKGCYLGQEVIERMRTRDKLARRLVLLEIAGELVPTPGSAIAHDGSDVGKVTSAVSSIKTGQPIALAYLKTAASDPGTSVTVKTDGGDLAVIVAALPTGVPAKA